MGDCRKHGYRRSDAFTLIEVIVAVGIIGVLAGLLLPALGSVRSDANMVVCQGRLRNLGIALSMYAEHNGSLCPVGESLNTPQPELARLVPRYIPDARNLYCPSETDPALSFSQANFRASRIGYFYYSCRSLPDDRNISRSLRWGLPGWPRQLRLDSRFPSNTWVMSDAWFRGRPTPHTGSRKCVNYLTLDGSVCTAEESPKDSFR